MKRSVLLGTAGTLVLGAVLGGLAWQQWEGRISTAAAVHGDPSVQWIVDAGHGGEDGGAVSPGGMVESRINLEIARRVDGIFGFCGEPALMLRTEDISLHDPEAVTLREKKASDLHNRAQTASEYPEAALVSIHQNMFQQSRYRGTQVFYAPTQGSQELAQAIQGVVRESLQPENSRESKPIPSTVYLMNHIPNRAVLVECGFLSNPKEEARLCTPEYRQALAAAVADGLEDYFSPQES